MKIIKYVLIVFVLIVSTLFYCHCYNLKKTNNEVEILQTIRPSINKIQDLLVKKSPTVFKDVLYEWEPIVNIFDKSLDNINQMLSNDNTFHKDLIDCFNSYSLFGSLGWEYFFFKKTINNTENHFTLQTQHRHLICQVLGVQRIYLASPNQSKYIKSKQLDIKANDSSYLKKNNTKSIVDFWNENETSIAPFNKLEFIEIILREGNILYIPYGWWFLKQIEKDSLILEGFNISVVSLFC